MKKSERLNQELIFLSYRDKFNLKQLQDQFHISERTALRDISSLEEIGLTFYVEKGRYGAYHLTQNKLWTAIHFNLEEINAIFFALKAVNKMTTTPFSNAYSQIYQKLMKSLPETRRKNALAHQEAVSYRQQPSLHEVKYFKLLIKAATDNLVLNATSHQYFKNPQDVQISNIFYQQGNWFCYLYNLDQDKWFIARCDQLENCKLRNKKGLSRDELTRSYDKFYRFYYDHRFECELTQLGKEQTLLNLYPTMKIKEKDGKNIFTGLYNSQEQDYLVDYLIGLGANVQIISPKSLKKAYLDKMNDILSQYE